jgi:hypothetical protein
MRNLLLTQTMTGTLPIPSKQDLVDLKNSLRAFHEDDRGDNENLGRMLVMGLILIPIVIILAIYGQEIVDVVKEEYAQVIGQKGKIKK